MDNSISTRNDPDDTDAKFKTKDTALDGVQSGDPPINKRRKAYVRHARAMAMSIFLRVHRPITSDDLWETCPPPDDFDPRILGAVFRKGWRRVGYTAAKRKRAHASPQSQWVPTGAAGDQFEDRGLGKWH